MSIILQCDSADCVKQALCTMRAGSLRYADGWAVAIGQDRIRRRLLLGSSECGGETIGKRR